jgi:hypothetical protein
MSTMLMLDRFVTEDGLAAELFVVASRRGEPVARCGCGGWMDGSIDRTRRITFYVMTCRSCGREQVSPNGRLSREASPAARPVPPALLDAWRERDRAMLGEKDDDD